MSIGLPGRWALGFRGAVALGLALAGCGRGGDPGAAGEGSASPSAKWDIVEMFRRDAAVARHPSDGGGRAWLEERGEGVVAGGSGRWRIVFETGPLGVAEGGWVYLQVPPFWGWSTPQAEAPEAPGYTTVSTDAEGVELTATTLDQQLLGIEVGGRALAEGERVEIVYGAGEAGARADRFAESRTRFYVAVDGDADGVRTVLSDPLWVDVLPGAPARLVLTVGSTARPGERVRLTAAVLDRTANAGLAVEGELELEASAPGLELPARLRFEPRHGGVRTVEVGARGTGTFQIGARGVSGDLERLQAASNPLVVADDPVNILWGDLHGHSNFSDGSATPAEYFRYARDVAALDVVALTDHDHWGMEPLAERPEMWEEIRRETELFHKPGRFVTLLGYEWTSWIHGHRHILYFEDRGEVLSALDPAYETPSRLWEALRGRPALTFAHHSGGGPVATNWAYPPDPVLEPVTEIVSVHGSSEAIDSPGLIYSPVAGNFVRDALDRGYVLGFVGSGDSHDGHPGLAALNGASGGLAAILGEELTREGVLAALRARRVYATSGPRIVLEAALGGHPMGASIPAAALRGPSGSAELSVRVAAPLPLDRLDVVRSGAVVETVDAGGRHDLELRRAVERLERDEYLYVRAVQVDGAAAWSSPFFVE